MRCLLIAVLFIASLGPAVAQSPAPAGATRTYYVAAQETDWNYLPLKRDAMMPASMPAMGYAKLALKHDAHVIGTTYHKAMYVQYTDASFTTRSPRPSYLGLFGPMLHAEVGDTVRIVFRNKATRPYSLHMHGLAYAKSSEGSAFGDVPPSAGDAVAPGATFTYVYTVPERAGPGPSDPSSIGWLFHSHVDERRDVNAGLTGLMIVTRAGMARPDGTPKDVDREFGALFMMYDENQSPYIDANIKRFVKQPTKNLKFDGGNQVDPNGNFDPLFGNGFSALNIRSTINGFQYANMPNPTMHRGEHVRWYVATIGEGFNFHTAHWHGNTVTTAGQRSDVISLAPAQTVTADMIPDAPGTWMLHCHVSEHMSGGMAAAYTVLP